MDLGIKGKVALCLASSKGLGRAVAMEFAREGAKVVICARNQEALALAQQEISASTGAEVLAIAADVTSESDRKHLVEAALAHFGQIDILVCNAGGPKPGQFETLSDQDWLTAFNLNLMSSVALIRLVLPSMKAHGWGRIVNMTSVSVKQPLDGLMLSNSIRTAVIGMAKTLAKEVANHNILVNNVCPGMFRTGRLESLIASRVQANQTSAEMEWDKLTRTIPLGRIGSPAEFAPLVVFLCSDKASYMTGTTIQIDGGASQGLL
jgi:3-oxoacyl-[acyl-carrier protein] reductase